MLITAMATALVILAGLVGYGTQRGQAWQLCPAGPTVGAELERLRELTQSELAASVSADVARLEHLLAQDFTLASPSGAVLDRRQLIGAIASGELDFHSIRLHPDDSATVVVRLDCGSALVTYRTSIDVTGGATRYVHGAQHTDVWVKREGEWQHLRAHTTALGGYPPSLR